MATDLHPLQERGSDRVQPLTDGVLAIVLTILVLALRPPAGPVAALGPELRSLVPALRFPRDRGGMAYNEEARAPR